MTRAPRADSVRNRARILEATREQIARHGPGVGMDEIASAAGVAVGTLYRHFPTKSDLVSAVLDEYMQRVADEAEAAADRVRAGADATQELTSFIVGVVEESAHNHAAKAAAATLAPTPTGSAARTRAAETRAAAAVGAVLRTAQRDGQIRSDLTVDDLYLLVATAPYEHGAPALRRWQDLVIPGLRRSDDPKRSARASRP